MGQPRSTIDPLSWLRTGAIVIVNTSKGTVGEDTSAPLGATLLNLVALAIGEQAALDSSHRRAMSIIVDEFHTMPGADYEGILSELAKYGANLVLATQSLTRLDALDREQNRALRAMVFANLDGLLAFHTSAEDAAYLVRELGGEVDEADLVALGEHQCYIKLSVDGERTPTFSVRLDALPQTDADLCAHLAADSAARYGRDRAAVERDIKAALASLERQEPFQNLNAPNPGSSKSPGRVAEGNPTSGTSRVRTKKRQQAATAELQQQMPMDEGESGAVDAFHRLMDDESGLWREAEPA